MMTTAAVMVISQAFSLCLLVLSTIVASLRGMLNLVHPLLLLHTAVVKRKAGKTSRQLQLIYIMVAQKVTLGLPPLLLWLQVCHCPIIPIYDAGMFFSLGIHKSAMFTGICYVVPGLEIEKNLSCQKVTIREVMVAKCKVRASFNQHCYSASGRLWLRLWDRPKYLILNDLKHENTFKKNSRRLLHDSVTLSSKLTKY